VQCSTREYQNLMSKVYRPLGLILAIDLTGTKLFRIPKLASGVSLSETTLNDGGPFDSLADGPK